MTYGHVLGHDSLSKTIIMRLVKPWEKTKDGMYIINSERHGTKKLSKAEESESFD